MNGPEEPDRKKETVLGDVCEAGLEVVDAALGIGSAIIETGGSVLGGAAEIAGSAVEVGGEALSGCAGCAPVVLLAFLVPIAIITSQIIA